MATYKEIKGTNIEVLASDPSNPVVGQVWFNSTSNVLKGDAGTLVGAWATANSMNTARERLAGSGIKTATLAFGGYDGSGTRYALTESYNGTNWTEVNDLNLARQSLAGAGTQTAALAFGGLSGPPFIVHAQTELWNGTNWTEVNDLNTARRGLAGVGTQTAALAFGGEVNPPVSAATESWNGTNWTEVNDLNTARGGSGSAGADNTSGLVFGGTPPTTGKTEEWNDPGTITQTITTS